MRFEVIFPFWMMWAVCLLCIAFIILKCVSCSHGSELETLRCEYTMCINLRSKDVKVEPWEAEGDLETRVIRHRHWEVGNVKDKRGL